jgi:hypothetical protein
MPTKDEEAVKLAHIHYEVEEGMIHIFRLTGSPEAEISPTEPIKLLEVNESTVPYGILPLHFGPLRAAGIHYPSVIVEVTPEEYKQIQAEELKLPNGWKVGELIPRPRPSVAEVRSAVQHEVLRQFGELKGVELMPKPPLEDSP